MAQHTPHRISITRLAPQRYQVSWICPCGRLVAQRIHTDASAREIGAALRTYTDYPACHKAGASHTSAGALASARGAQRDARSLYRLPG